MNIHDHPNSLCEFIDIGLDNYQCIKCGVTISSHDGIPVLFCSAINEHDIAHIEQTGLGCSAEQIAKRFAICQSCDFFKDNSCSKCGCRVVRNKEFKNKLLWKNEQCPMDKWGKED